jgi:hypothetical protein
VPGDGSGPATRRGAGGTSLGPTYRAVRASLLSRQPTRRARPGSTEEGSELGRLRRQVECTSRRSQGARARLRPPALGQVSVEGAVDSPSSGGPTGRGTLSDRAGRHAVDQCEAGGRLREPETR